MTSANDKGLGFWTLTFLVVANMIGAGVFTTSGYTLESLRDPKLVLFAWFSAGLLALCGAHSYGLLVQRMPVSGGEYAFLSRAAHPLAGFIAGWVSLLAGFSGAIAFAAIAMESYLPGIFPPKVLAASVVILGALIHGAKRIIGISTQNIAVIFKLILLAIFLSFSTWSATQGKWQGNSLPFTGEGIGLLAFAQAMVWISLSYSGFNAGVYVAGEATSPRVVSRSLITGTAIVTLLYLLLNAAFVLAPPPSKISGQADIAAHAAMWIGGESFANFTRLVLSLALFTSVLSMMMAGPRVYGKMAEDGILPKVFILKPDCTWPAVTLQMSLALLLIFITNLQDLLAFLGLTLSLSASASVLCLFLGDPTKRPRGLTALPPLIFIIATLITAILLVIHDPGQALGTILTITIAAAAYQLMKPRPS
ncbi:MAG: amino acid permease [Akkermansiaceae bacterium]|nr:amino acid permease [Akkermansiaceae bacterium]